MGRSIQPLLSTQFRRTTEHGGTLVRGKRKTARPLATKRAMHVVFRARTTGMHRHASAIRAMQSQLAARYEIRIYRASNNDNHLHQVIRGRTRQGLQNYFRAFAGHVAQLVTGARKGRKTIEGFWLNPVWTRILQWGQAFQTACAYVVQNQLEAEGRVPYRPRSRSRFPSKKIKPETWPKALSRHG